MSDERMIRVDNLKLLMKSNGLNKADLSKLLITSDSYVSKLLSGRPGTFGEKAARKVEEKFKKPRFWLDEVHPQGEYSDESLKQAAPLPAAERAGEYNVLKLVVNAENATDCTLLPVITWEQLPMLFFKNTESRLANTEHIRTDARASDSAKWLQIQDDDASMADRLPPGTRLLVEPCETEEAVSAGAFVIIHLQPDEYIVRRYKQVTRGRFLAEPVNPAYATLDSETTPMRVVAVVKQALIRF